ncbi:divalent metal cation (Fe/Co/Zn/Cd) transporter [Brevundimonas alba]|uniref:Divalent metal cation (Fe/Co/Zn/Cd) transporter n=1 Tax=Brevundimonas alba TaxID=74314 RepID=A0A7X5YL91_9CAUL|nr:hypothetical protein [Brevundimonas alba]NJC40600.1 divalent metal cation (Fe/Co/Zn/Cd) transporter [Brevundimonas alba]
MMLLVTQRAPEALVTAAAAGGVATGAGFVLAMAGTTLPSSLPSPLVVVTGLAMAVVMLGVIAVLAAFVFAAGLFIVGLPAWAALYKLGFRARVDVIVAGGVLTGITVALLFPWYALNPDTAVFPMLMILPGAFAGWTFHRIAYGKAGPAPA